MKKSYLFLVFGVVSAVIVLIVMLYKMDRYLYNEEIAKIEVSHKRIEDSLVKFKARKELLLQTISSYLTKNYDDLKDNSDKKIVIEDFFYNLVKSNKVIMQLRFIDLYGKEKIRVDRTSLNKVLIKDKSQLQDKSNRDYFRKFSQLKQNHIGYSSIDLNREYGKIELPWRPTLRMGSPVYSADKMVGIVVINFLMENLINEMKQTTDNNLYLVDSKGYFIIHPKDNWSWSEYQSPSKKLRDYFTYLKQDEIENNFNDFYKHNLGIKKINFFNDEELFFIYEPKIPIHEIIFDKSIIIGSFILLALLLILIPVIKLLKVMFEEIKIEKDKVEKSRDSLTKIFDNTFDAIFVINRSGIIQKVNKSATTLFSYSEDELIGHNINMLIPEPHHSKHDQYLKDYKDNQKSKVINIDRELFAIDKYGVLIPISLSVTKVEIDGKRLFIGSIKDFSELHKSQEQQRKQESMLLQQSKLAAMGEMINAIAHQWRQPLNSIGLIVQDLVSAEKYNELNGEYMKKSKDDIMNQLKLMSNTIDSFRSFFSKSRKASDFNVIDIIKELHSLYWAQFNAHNIELELLCQDEKKAFIDCDIVELKDIYEIKSYPSELKQVLLNLISNSKDAIVNIENSNDFERKIVINLSAFEDEIVISVIDNAGGIPEDIETRVFEPYFTTKEMGTGLGLFIVKSIMKEHFSGDISYAKVINEFEGRVYEGSKFTLNIPKTLPSN